MSKPERDLESGWDSREHFAREIVRLITVFNIIGRDPQGEHIKDKIEALIDLFDTTAAWYKKEGENIDKNILDIEGHFYNPAIPSQRPRIIRETEIRIRKQYREVMRNIMKAGLLMPEKEYFDEVEAIKAQYL
jgi:hypothetical protein